MGLGALALKLRQMSKDGPRTVYRRDVLRRRILSAPPIRGLTDDRCEVHVMTSSRDWLDLLWALRSFYRFSGRRYALCIHDDGTLTDAIVPHLQHAFPDARLIRRAQADAEVLPGLAAYPRCQQFRRENHLSPKVFDFAHYLRGERMLLMDSDVLFFRRPDELIRRIEDPSYLKNSVNADVASAYTVTPAAVRERFGFELIERFNSGLGLIHRDSLRLDWIEEFLALPGIIGHFWRIEQTIYALCSSRHGVELLPPEYVGAVRHLLYRQGIPRLVRSGILDPLDRERKPLKVVHLPVYYDNAYQSMLMKAQREIGIDAISGGSGGTFLGTALRKWNADVIHFHWMHPYMLRPTRWGTILRSLRLLLDVIVLRLTDHAIVWTVHNLQNHAKQHVELERFFLRLFAKLTHRTTAGCRFAAEQAIKTYDLRPSRAHVVPLGNYVGWYPNTIGRTEARSRLNLPEDALVFLFLGRIEPYKGVNALIDAFKDLDAPMARLLIAGKLADPDLERALDERASRDPRVLLKKGFVPDDEVQVYMNAADVVIYPYRDILTSGAVILAMSFGKACIAVDKGCIPEILGNDSELLYASRNPLALEAAMEKAIALADRLAEIGNRNRRRADEWDNVTIARKIAAVYREALRDR
jgi:glycosyltransferase involved in cell wall biosynthesis